MQKGEINRLREEQVQALDATNRRQADLEKYKGDYKTLQSRLSTLPDKINHDVMVPFGKLAFMPGQLVHTNEIMVLLGDNWFAERSAKQAVDIVDRRIAAIDKQIGDLDKQKGLLEPRLEFTSELKNLAEGAHGVVEIQEEYDPVKEKQWRDEHRQRVKAHRKNMREQGSSKPKPPTCRESSDAELWARLDELELQERRNHEIRKLSEEGNSLTDVNIPTECHSDIPVTPKSVHWKDQEEKEEEWVTDDEEDDDDDDEEEEEAEEEEAGDEEDTVRQPTTIFFSHYSFSKQKPQEDATETTPKASSSPEPNIQSPANIYDYFVAPHKHTPRSILKRSSSVDSDTSAMHHHHQVDETGDATEAVQAKPSAFKGTIVERDPIPMGPVDLPAISTRHTESENSALQETLDDQESQQQQQPEPPPKRVSKFKARRMQQSR